MGYNADTSEYTKEEIAVWNKLAENEGREFRTFKGLSFTYRIQGNEMFISRKKKSLTRSSLNIAYRNGRKLMEEEGFVSGPKKLGTFGASYIYAIFKELSIIEGRRKIKEQTERTYDNADIHSRHRGLDG